MNGFLLEVVAALRQGAGGEPWLLASSPGAGRFWLEQWKQIAPDLPPPKVTSIWHMAIELAGPALAKLQLTLLSPEECETILWQLWPSLAEMAEAAQLTGTDTERIASLQRTIVDLRCVELSSDELELDAFERQDTGGVLRQALHLFEQHLRTHRLADPAQVFQLARDRLLGEGRWFDRVLIIPDVPGLVGLPQSILDQIPETQKRVTCASVEESLPLFEGAPTFGRGAFPSQDAASVSRVELQRALDPMFEVRFVLGRLLERQIPWDQAEILYPEDSEYSGLIWEGVCSIPRCGESPNDDQNPDGRCTFAAGFPIRWTSPGRMLRIWRQWLDHQFRAAELYDLISRQLVTFPKGLTLRSALTMVRKLASCTGQAAWRASLHRQTQTPTSADADSHSWHLFKRLVESLLPPEGNSPNAPARMWQQVGKLLQLTPCWNTRDQSAQTRAQQLIQQFSPCITKETDILDRLAYWVEHESLPPEEPRAGWLHASPIPLGKTSSRSQLLIIGLSEDFFPRKIPRTSWLSDNERRRIAPELAAGLEDLTLAKQEQRLEALLRSHAGQLIMTYACMDQLAEREAFPCQVFLHWLRKISGKPLASLTQLEECLPEPLGPDSVLCHLSLADSFHIAPPVGLLDTSTRSAFPHLSRGASALQARRQARFSEYDGWVLGAGAAMNLANTTWVFSAQALESLLKCPRQFFWEHLLEIEPPPALEVEHWLTPPVCGAILHAVFHDFHQKLHRENRPPQYPQDESTLQSLLRIHLEATAGSLHADPADIPQDTETELRNALHYFLQAELELSPTHTSRFLETTMGMQLCGEAHSPLDSDLPLAHRLASGRTMYLRGRVDRIDELAPTSSNVNPPRYKIWDYKTGNADRYLGISLGSGEYLQPLIYCLLVQDRLRQAIHPGAKVEGMGLLCAGQLGYGERVEWNSEEILASAGILDRLADLLETGAFNAALDESTCRFCDIRAACDIPAAHQQIHAKLEFEANAMLQPLRLLRPARGKRHAGSP